MNESLLPNADKEANRRRALAKVYKLLLKLAEETENKSPISDQQITEETNNDTREEESIERF
jgi:hypothetical protein